jgi:uncharacterized protein (TIGR00290 family)
MKEKVFASWSGGKDCCLALYRAVKAGFDVRYLVNMITADGKRSCSHGISAAIIKKQAEAFGIPILQHRTTGENYEAVFSETLQELKKEGVTGGIFGDIDFSPHREWIERVCANAGITPHLPLWQEDQTKLMNEFINTGFKSIVVAVKADILGKEVLGKTINKEFLAYLVGLDKNVTPCGESGEYHSLVVDGPIFKKRLVILETKKVSRGEHHYLEISQFRIE